MRIIEFIMIAFFLCTFIGTTALLLFKYFKEQEAKGFMEEALRSNNRKRIEDGLILYGDYIPSKVKDSIQLRISDLVIEEDELELSRKINELEKN